VVVRIKSWWQVSDQMADNGEGKDNAADKVEH
jgi:hypothetical protein